MSDKLPLYKNIDQTGKVWGSWKILSFSNFDSNNYNHKWRCLCLGCNKEYDVINSNITLGKSKSCVTCCGLSADKNGNWKGYKDISSSYFTHIKHGAKNRDIGFKISIEDMQKVLELQSYKCALTGIKLNPSNMSLDRIDSSVGYVVGNIQWVLKDINRMKSDLNQDNFIELCRLVALNQ